MVYETNEYNRRKEYIAFQLPGRQGTEKFYARLNILWVINKNVLGIYYAEKKNSHYATLRRLANM
jgi:hypothetical protein